MSDEYRLDLTDEEIGAHRLEYLETCLAKRWQVPTEDIALLIIGSVLADYRRLAATSAQTVTPRC